MGEGWRGHEEKRCNAEVMDRNAGKDWDKLGRIGREGKEKGIDCTEKYRPLFFMFAKE